MGRETVTIPKTEYDELLMIKEHAKERASLERKAGRAWETHQKLVAFNDYLKDNLIGYDAKRKEFNRIWERRGGHNA